MPFTRAFLSYTATMPNIATIHAIRKTSLLSQNLIGANTKTKVASVGGGVGNSFQANPLINNVLQNMRQTVD